jgi:predicted O-methyltransferase YrrM
MTVRNFPIPIDRWPEGLGAVMYDWPTLYAQWVPGDPYQPEPPTPLYYETKARIAAWIQPDSVLEIGVRAGYSALAFHMGHPFSQYVGIDADMGGWGGVQGYLREAEDRLARLGIEHRLVTGNTQLMTELPWPHHAPPYMVHIDGDHSYGGAMHDMLMALTLGARYLVVDDYDFIPAVRAACDHLVGVRGLRAHYVGDGGYRGNLVIENEGGDL